MRLSNQNLKNLVEYLIQHNDLSLDFRELEIVYDPDQDALNEKDPRAFCYVVQDDWKIYCTRNLEALPPEARMGILLHEIGHLHLDAFGAEEGNDNDEFEADVDAWILGNVPEASYTYEDVEYYALIGNLRGAKNLQCVSTQFLRRVER
jgi:hypothetical protein